MSLHTACRMVGWRLMVRSPGMHIRCRGKDLYLRSACTTWISSLILLDQACSQRCTCMRSRWKRICMLLQVTSYLLSRPLDCTLTTQIRSGQPLSDAHFQSFIYQTLCGLKVRCLPHETTRTDKIVYPLCQSLAPRSETWKPTRQCRL